MNPLLTLRHRLGPNATRVAVVSALVLFALLFVYVVSSSTGGTYTAKAVFDDVRGLIPGGEVRAGAIPVGSVESVEINDREQPVVTMRIDQGFQLHEGATADIRLGSNVGAVNRAVELTQGDILKPALPDGATLAGAQTDQPVNFDEAVQTLDPPTRANIRLFLGGLDAALKGRGKDFDRTLAHSSAATNETANLLSQVNADGAALKTLVRQGDRVTSALASSPQDLGEAADRTASLLRITAGREAELRRSIQLLGPALARGRDALDRLTAATPNLRALVHGLGPVVDELGPLARILPPATGAAGPFLTQTRKLVEQGPRYLRQFRPIIAAAGRVAPKLNTVVRTVSPLGEELRAYIPETIGFFQNFGAATGSYDAVGHLINTAAGSAQTLPPSTAGAEIGKTDCTPGLLELPYIRSPGTLVCQPWTNFEDSFISGGLP